MAIGLASRTAGDVLVVDTIGLNDKTWLNGQGVPHRDQLHVIERYMLPDLGRLNVEITLEDSKPFTKTTHVHPNVHVTAQLGNS
jgi:hypothetical protein